MHSIRRFGLVFLAGILLAGTVACSDTRVRNAANVGGAWACDDGQRGLLYQITKNNGVTRVYKYVKTQGGSNPKWDDVLVAEVTNVPTGFVLNAMSMTPQGVMYAVLSPDGGSNNRYDLVRIDPPQSGSTTTSFTKIADFPESRNDRSVNSGTYIEIGGVPHLAMGNNTAKINSELYNLNTGTFTDWIGSKTGGTVKDVVWLRNPVTFQGVSYNMVGINENGQNETMLFNGSGQFAKAPTEFKNTPAGWGIDTSKGFGVGGSFGAQGQGDSVFFTRNDGHLFEWSWDGRSKGEMTWQGRSNPSSDNDGSSCGALSIDPPVTTTTTTTTTTVPPAVVSATSCSVSSTGLIQAIKGLEGDDIVSFKLLDLDAGDYVDMDPAVSLDLDAIGFGGVDGFNATAIDKNTGKMFATINAGSDLWLVQFDLEPTPNIAFLGKVKHPDSQGGFSATVTSDGTYVMNYYIDGLVEIPNVSSLTAYGTPDAASGVDLGIVHSTSVLGWHGDLASITLSDNSEHVVGYNPGTNKVVLAPVGDLSNPVAYTTTFPSSFGTSGENLGASWSTDDTVYFSRNDGEGVFAVSADDIDIEAQELIMRATSVTSTVTTSSNDGFGCPGAEDVPDTFAPTVDATVACSTDYKGSYTVTVDNTISSVDASIEIDVAGTVTSYTLAAGAVETFAGTVANNSTVTATATNAAFTETSESDTATLEACVAPTTTTTTSTTTTTTLPPTTTTTVPPVVIGATSCSTNPTGLIQQYNVNGVVQFKKLDVTAGDYVDLDPPLSLDLTTHGFTNSAKLNATAIDHSTGKIFGVITDSAGSWLVQFDMSATPNVLYLGKVVGGYAATVTSDGTYVFNYGGNGLNAITGISSLATFEDRTDVPAESLGTRVYEGTAFGPAGDYTSMTLADGREAIVGYNNSTNKMVIAPVEDLGNPIKLTVAALASFSTAGDTLGAAWSFDGDAFFSRNNGGGLFMLASGNIDLNAGTATLAATAITSTQTTNSNDGFGCAGLDDVPDTFAPVVNVTVTCSTDYKGSYMVSVDNTTSSVDATVEIDVAGTATSHTVPAGESKTFAATLANDATVTATATNAAFAETSVSDTATLSDCTHVVDPQITITLECSDTFEGTASYTIDNSASTLDVAVSYFIDGVETNQATLVAGGTIGVVDIPINNGSTIEVTATADRYEAETKSASLTGCVAPDVFKPTVAVELACSNGTGTYRAVVDNSTSNVDATATVTVDGEAVGDPVTVAAGETEELTGSVANGQQVVATASSTGQTAESDSDTLDGCVQIQVFGPSLSVSTACSAEGTGSYSATVDNTLSDMDVNVVVSINGVDSDPVVVAAGGTETLTGAIDNDSIVTVTASAGDDTREVSATLTDCTPPPTTTTTTTTTTTVPETTTTTTPPAATTTAPATTSPPTLPATPAEEDTTTTAPPTLPATGNQSFPSPTTWAALLLLSAGILFGKAARRRT